MSGTTKWDDGAIKDLIMAVLMSANGGNINVSANWDQVAETMESWGYAFTKSAMSQHWSKKIVKQFKERHGDVKASDNVDVPPTTPKTPKPLKNPGSARKRAPTKTPGSGRGKKRVAADDDEEASPETGHVADYIAKNKTPRSAAKKVKCEKEEDSEAEAEAMAMDNEMEELEEEMEAVADEKAQKEDRDFLAV